MTTLRVVEQDKPGELMPIGAVGEAHISSMSEVFAPGVAEHVQRSASGRAVVGSEWAGVGYPTNQWIFGRTGTGKSCLAMSKALAAADRGHGFVYIGHSVSVLRRGLAGHADRVVEVDLSFDDNTELCHSLNPLDLSVVLEDHRDDYARVLRRFLPSVLHVHHSDRDAARPGSRPSYRFGRGMNRENETVLDYTIAALLELNKSLPPESQTTVFTVGTLLSDTAARERIVERLKPVQKRWWETAFPHIPLAPLEIRVRKWRTSIQTQAMMGSPRSTLRWPGVINNNRIVLVTPPTGNSDTETMLLRVVMLGISAAFLSRSADYRPDEWSPYHVFLDDFSSYADTIDDFALVILEELRKYGATSCFVHQDLERIPDHLVKALRGNTTHVYGGGTNKEHASATAKLFGWDEHQLRSLPRRSFVVTFPGPDGKPMTSRPGFEGVLPAVLFEQPAEQPVFDCSGLRRVEALFRDYDRLPGLLEAHLAETGTAQAVA